MKCVRELAGMQFFFTLTSPARLGLALTGPNRIQNAVKALLTAGVFSGFATGSNPDGGKHDELYRMDTEGFFFFFSILYKIYMFWWLCHGDSS